MSDHAMPGRAPLAGLVLLLLLGLATSASAGKLLVEPHSVNINSFFSGIQMTVTGDLPPGSQAVLTVRGKRIEEELMRKFQHWDLWMNGGDVDIYDAPLLYMAFSSEPDLLSPAAGWVPWGYASLERNARFVGRVKPVEDVGIFKEFVRLKERDKLYREEPGGLRITHASPERWQAQARFWLPSRLKHGVYHVSLWIIKDGKLVGKRTATFKVKMVGVPALLHAMARKHDVLYGFLAVLLAMVVGMLTGLVFHRKGGGH